MQVSHHWKSKINAFHWAILQGIRLLCKIDVSSSLLKRLSADFALEQVLITLLFAIVPTHWGVKSGTWKELILSKAIN